jgi:hypothetical protein
MASALPDHPDLELEKKQAKHCLRHTARAIHPRWRACTLGYRD